MVDRIRNAQERTGYPAGFVCPASAGGGWHSASDLLPLDLFGLHADKQPIDLVEGTDQGQAPPWTGSAVARKPVVVRRVDAIRICDRRYRLCTGFEQCRNGAHGDAGLPGGGGGFVPADLRGGVRKGCRDRRERGNQSGTYNLRPNRVDFNSPYSFYCIRKFLFMELLQSTL